MKLLKIAIIIGLLSGFGYAGSIPISGTIQLPNGSASPTATPSRTPAIVSRVSLLKAGIDNVLLALCVDILVCLLIWSTKRGRHRPSPHSQTISQKSDQSQVHES